MPLLPTYAYGDFSVLDIESLRCVIALTNQYSRPMMKSIAIKWLPGTQYRSVGKV